MPSIRILQPPVIEVRPLQTAQPDMYVSEDSVSTKAGVSQTPNSGYRSLPRPEHAKEVISSRLDTYAGKIKGELGFEQFGALKIGNAQEGKTGELLMTGDGVLVTNINGETTFALDGRTGSPFFAGELAAGSIMTGKIDMGADGYIIGGDQINYRWVLGKLP